MPPLSMLIKPVSGSCNLRCRYCFYHGARGVMSPETAAVMVSKALDFADRFCVFAFQGGEPTLAGLPFYQHVVKLQKKHNRKGITVNNVIQTNGINIDEPWAVFLAKHRFLVGLSLDGGMEMHDRNRLYPDGSGTYQRVMETVALFNRLDVQYNILAVLTEEMAWQAQNTYAFFKENKFRYLQFIPCLDALDHTGPSALSPEAYLHFLKTTFDLWSEDIKRGRYISIRYFDNLFGMVMGYPPEACNMAGVCSCQFVIEADGSVYPCDFYVTDTWKIGDIHHDGFADMRFSPVCERFIQESQTPRPACTRCKWHALCRGGCRRERSPQYNPRTHYRFCQTMKAFLAYALPGFIELGRYRTR